MNFKKKLITFFIFLSIIFLSIINMKNREKTIFFLLTTKQEISLGNLISITFMSGFTFSTILTLISKNNLQESLGDKFIKEQEIDKSDENYFSHEIEHDRPPERDVRESQPTISVNYRFVDRANNSYDTKNTRDANNNLNNEDNDWLNYDNEW
tara:strand:- start:3 stop:461 length:459 start_codon:yes stop_codon:yes gene_type:complete